MKLQKHYALLILLTLLSCNKNTVSEQFDKDFKENRWQRSDIKTYSFTITDATKNYDLIFDFSYVDGYQFATVPIKIEIENPDKTITVKNFALKIKDDTGKQTGECDGDYCDISYCVWPNTHLTPGNYTVKVSNNFQAGYLPNIIGVGIKVNITQ
ncbi:MAG: hypothetical protein PSV16_02315 [Flavobacterium sp.]|nr:hypothetical protein [Flavobacterium sp.]